MEGKIYKSGSFEMVFGDGFCDVTYSNPGLNITSLFYSDTAGNLYYPKNVSRGFQGFFIDD